MNYSNFAARVRQQKRPIARTLYPPELMATLSALVLQDHVRPAHVVRELVKEPEWQNHSAAALRTALSRHLAKLRRSS
jgi:hypothetical protein